MFGAVDFIFTITMLVPPHMGSYWMASPLLPLTIVICQADDGL